MLEVFIRWPYESEGGGKDVLCVVEVSPAGAGCTLRLKDNEFEPYFDVDAWNDSRTFYFFAATREEWKNFWRTLRLAARKMGESIKVVDYACHLDGPGSIPFPDAKVLREVA